LGGILRPTGPWARGARRFAFGLLLALLALAALRQATGGLPYVTGQKTWSIGIYEGPSPFELSPAAVNPVLTARDVTDVPARFVADPFLFRRPAGWTLFFEVFNGYTHKGDIGYADSTDGKKWRYGGIVLDEPFSLSYPHVFEWNGGIYMLPESGAALEVRLYRATDFPTHWVLVKPLLRGKPFADSSVFRHGELWWILTSTLGDFSLDAYYAEDLLGPWRPHGKNPVVPLAPHAGRCGGRVVTVDGKIIRFAQDDAPTYGLRVCALEIDTLSPTEYHERPASPTALLGPSGRGWNAGGMHTLDAHERAGGGWIAAVDGWRRGLWFGLRRWP
jgi:hypothetical protein